MVALHEYCIDNFIGLSPNILILTGNAKKCNFLIVKLIINLQQTDKLAFVTEWFFRVASTFVC